jgi:hypothetical protein
MKYITLIIGLLVVGCGKQEQTDTNESTPTTNTNKADVPRVHPDGDVDLPVKELTKEDVVGTYEEKIGNLTIKSVLLETGKVEIFLNGEKYAEYTWKIVEKEVHILFLNIVGKKSSVVFKIEPNGDLTQVAEIAYGKREDTPKNAQTTIKKLK